MPQRTTHGRLGALLAVMCAALALVIGAGSSLALAMPEIARSTGASQTELTWVVNVYALVFAALLLPFGIAADKYGRRTALLLGLGVFAVCSLASGLVADPTQLVVLRALAGAGAAAVMPATLSVLVDAYPPERRSSAIGVWAAVSGAGALLGLLIAGVLLEFAWWGSVQIAFGVLSAFVLALCVAVVPPSADPHLSLDPVGGLLALVGLAGVVYGVIEGPERGWTDGLTVTALAGGVLVLAAFVLAELRSPHPMLDVRLFRSAGLSAGSVVVFLQFFAAFGLFFLAPQWLQYVHGLSPLQAALWLAPMALGIGPTAQAAPALLRRFGPRPVAAWGMAQMAVGLGLLAWQADGGAPLWQFGASLFVFGIGFGLALTPGTTLIIDGLPADRRTLAAAVNDVTREVGGALGGAVAASVLLTGYGDRVLGAVSGLSAPDAAQAETGIAQALGLSARLGPEGAAVAAGARDAFATGYATALSVGAAVLLAGAVLCGVLSSRAAAGRRRLLERLRTSASGAPRALPWTVHAAVTGVLVLGVLAGVWLLPPAFLHDRTDDDAPPTALAQDGDTARTSAPALAPVLPVEAPELPSPLPTSASPDDASPVAPSPAGPQEEALPPPAPVPPETTSAGPSTDAAPSTAASTTPSTSTPPATSTPATTSAAPSTSEPPPTSSAPPETTSAPPPPSSSEPPATSSAPPATTSAAPSTSEPPPTSSAPPETTSAPPPPSSSEPPATSSAPPATTSAPPATSSATTSTTSTAPVTTTSAPPATSSAPVTTSSAPVTTSSAPVTTSSAPPATSSAPATTTTTTGSTPTTASPS